MQEAAKEALTKPENLDKAQAYIDFVKQNLEPMAHQLGVSIEWVWNILVQQARVEAVVCLIVIAALVIKLIVLGVVVLRALPKATFYDETKVKYSWGTETRRSFNPNIYGKVVTYGGWALLALTFITFVVTSSTLVTAVTGLVNPQYRAIEKIVQFAQPEKQDND